LKTNIQHRRAYKIRFVALQPCKNDGTENERIAGRKCLQQASSGQPEQTHTQCEKREIANAKTPAYEAGVENITSEKRQPSASGSSAGNTMDVGTIDAEVSQFAARHAAKFGNRLTILAPVVKGAGDVHNDPLS
jgi:hypothetical protein